MTTDTTQTTPTGQAIDTAADTTQTLVDRAAGTANQLVDRAADGAKRADAELREQGRAALDLGRDVLRAGLGAVGAAQEEGAKLFDTLVARGAKIEEKGTSKARETVDAAREGLDERRQQLGQTVEKVTETVERVIATPIAGAMRRVGVPTRAELRELADNVASLSARVDALIARLDAPAAPAAADAQPEVASDALGGAATHTR